VPVFGYSLVIAVRCGSPATESKLTFRAILSRSPGTQTLDIFRLSPKPQFLYVEQHDTLNIAKPVAGVRRAEQSEGSNVPLQRMDLVAFGGVDAFWGETSALGDWC
jgi:hypothetical protein